MESTQSGGAKIPVESRQSLKQEALQIIRIALNELLPTANSYIILQYGSALFCSETKDSDYDIIILCPIAQFRNYTQSVRDAFLFGDLMKSLMKGENMRVYDVRHAKIPILKIKFKEQLSLDVSLGLVNNNSVQDVRIDQLQSLDQETESVLQAVLICQEILRQVQITQTPIELFSQFLFYIKMWSYAYQIVKQGLEKVVWVVVFISRWNPMGYNHFIQVDFFLQLYECVQMCGNLILQYAQSQEFQDILQQKQSKALEFLLLKFFKFYSKWEWPNPINLFNCFPLPSQQKKGWNPIRSVSDSQHLMPIITPEIPPNTTVNYQQLNTAECVLKSSLQLYESEFARAYKLMRKISKGKLQINDLLQPYESFVSKTDGTIKPDSGFHFVIMIGILSQCSDQAIDGFYYHSKFSMAIESKIRSLLVHLDKFFYSISNLIVFIQHIEPSK